MERDFLACPSFVKLLMEDDFKKEIRIPNAFMRDFKNKLARKCVLIRGTTEKKSWPVRICRKENNLFICKRAWPNFVKDHKLKYGDYLLFWLVKKTTFVVIPYGADCSRKFEAYSSSDHDEFDCLEEDDVNEKDEDDDDDLDLSEGLSSKKANHKKRSRVCSDLSNNETQKSKQLRNSGIPVKEENKTEREETVDASTGHHETNLKTPFFTMQLKPTHKTQLTIPLKFAKEIKLNSKEIYFLHGEDDRKWHIKIRTYKGTNFKMGEGWSRFWKAYQVRVGDVCKFTLLKSLGNVFSVEITRP